jgi:formylglycine-generating enzyme required for sulfatase activity
VLLGPPLVLALAAEGSNPARLDWVFIPGGTFTMGAPETEQAASPDEGPVHQVAVKAFEMTRNEVTVTQYRRCVEVGACTVPGAGEGCNWGVLGHEDHPINCVDWDQAATFARWAGGRIPTEAEWEYAARGGRDTLYAGSNDVGAVAWHVGNSGGSTHPVGGKLPNGYGLHDMSGNVWEWVADWYHRSYAGAPADGSAWVEGGNAHRVIRGGSASYAGRPIRLAIRHGCSPGDRSAGLGFRLAR